MGSLERLRQDGYRTFDDVMDNSYDTVQDPTQRYLAIRFLLQQIRSHDAKVFLEECQPDLEHNRRVFLDMKSCGLNKLLEKLK